MVFGSTGEIPSAAGLFDRGTFSRYFWKFSTKMCESLKLRGYQLGEGQFPIGFDILRAKETVEQVSFGKYYTQKDIHI